VSFKKISCALW